MATAPRTAPVVRKMLVPTAIVAIVVAIGLPRLLAAMLDLNVEQTRYVSRAFELGLAITFSSIALGMLYSLRGVTGAPADDVNAQRRVLRLPVRLAGVTVVTGGATTMLALLVRMLLWRDSPWLVGGVTITATAIVGFLAVPVFALARSVLVPHAVFFAREGLPAGRRVPVGLLLGYTVLSVASIALVPAAVFGDARLGVARDRAAHERARATAIRLARATEDRSMSDAIRLCTRPLQHAVAIVQLPSGHLVPEGAAADVMDLTSEEAPLGGELRGGFVRIFPQPERSSRIGLGFLVVCLVGLATIVALSLARSLSRDARAVIGQVEALAEGRDPVAAPTVSIAEVRRVALAVNRLLDRIPRLQLEKFLAVERAEESRRLKSMFLANMSHDLRSPLNSILGFSELLTRGLEGPITYEQRHALDEIHATGSHLLRLLSEILDTARAESGHLDLDRKPTAPATFVTQARKEALRGRPSSVADHLEIDLQAGVVAVHVDALRFQQAMTHILNWAIDAAHGRPVRVEIGDRDRASGRVFVIEVSAELPTTHANEAALFQPFRKVEGVPGLHLALPLARRLVEAHGGTMEPLSAGEPPGTQPKLGVRVVLPRLDPLRDAGPKPAMPAGHRPTKKA